VVSAKDVVMDLQPDFVGMFMAAFCWLDFSEEAAVGMRLAGACWRRPLLGTMLLLRQGLVASTIFACCFFASDA
jgi:hypothetical protein